MSETNSQPGSELQLVVPKPEQLPHIVKWLSKFTDFAANHALFVDKTALLQKLVDQKFVFLSRPRRFGKSLLISMLKELFEHGTKNFEGLDIHDLWCEKTYPVLTLSFLDKNNPDTFEADLCTALRDAFYEAGFHEVYDFIPECNNFKVLSGRLVRQVLKGQQVVLLIDEWDDPLSSNLNQRDNFEKITVLLRHFYTWIRESNAFWFVWGMILLVIQGCLPLNPDGNIGQTAHQAFNTCISFMVNCNEQHYSGETGLTYFTQLFVIMLFQFVTAATGMAAMAGIMKALGEKTTQTIGNFWKYLVLSCTRILLPLSLVVGFILITQGIPMGFDGKMEITTLEGNPQSISQGPAAAVVPIKQLGTNGGGYYGVNSSHPLENPTYLSNMTECCSILMIPMAMVFAFGFYVNRKRLGYSIYGVMLAAFLIGVCINVSQEMGGNPRIGAMGIAQDG